MNLSYLEPAASAALRKELVLEAAALENIEVGWSHKKTEGQWNIQNHQPNAKTQNFSSNTTTFRQEVRNMGSHDKTIK